MGLTLVCDSGLLRKSVQRTELSEQRKARFLRRAWGDPGQREGTTEKDLTLFKHI